MERMAKMSKLYDVVILGGGPAGLAAGLYAGRAKLSTLIIEKGQDKILKKVGEEAVETVIASKNNSQKEVLYEMGDLWYHCLVLLAYHKLTPDQLLNELMSRRKGAAYHKFTGKTGVRPDL